MMIAKRFGVVVAAAAAVIGMSACQKSVQQSDVEEGIEEQVKTRDPNVSGVSCPDDLKAEVGATMECDVEGSDQFKKVKVEVKSVDGDEVRYDITPVE